MSQFLVPPPTPSPTTPTPESTELIPTKSASPSTVIKSWSLSALGTYDKCQLKARFKYVDRLPEVRGEAADRGVNFHKDIELFLTGERNSLPEKLSYYTQWFTELKRHEIYPEHTITLNARWEKVAPESQERWYKGVLDLLILIRKGGQGNLVGQTESTGQEVDAGSEPTETIIYDWKTGKIYPDHEDQRELYSLAVFSAFPSVQSVRAIHVYVDYRQLREQTYSRGQMHDMRVRWTNKATHFLSVLKTPEHMIPSPGYLCRWCAFSRAKGGPCRF
jgi:hypothetical protein